MLCPPLAHTLRPVRHVGDRPGADRRGWDTGAADCCVGRAADAVGDETLARWL